ncbi:MAG: TolC family protein [Bacteroidales bacterium]
MKRIILLLVVLYSSPGLMTALAGEVIKLSSKELEVLFIERNLEILAEAYQISMADAAIAQAKVWENPNLSVSNISFWSTSAQRNGEKNVIPPLFGKSGNNIEFSVELSQMISLARKRSKLVEVEKVSKEIAICQFEELLRSLKYEFRNIILNYSYTESLTEILSEQKTALEKLIRAYESQAINGNIASREVLRLKASQFEIDNEAVKLEKTIISLEKQIKSLLAIESPVRIHIDSSPDSYPKPANLLAENLIDQALSSRPDMSLKKLNLEYYAKNLRYEKAQRIPDLTVSLNYDRAGGVWKDFTGVGIGMDLPIFNRNKGNIKTMQYAIEQNKLHVRQQEINITNEVTESFTNYQKSYDFYFQDQHQLLIQEMKVMFQNYLKNMSERNISMIEFLDFMDVYRSNSEAWAEAKKDIGESFEELQYRIGHDLINNAQ